MSFVTARDSSPNHNDGTYENVPVLSSVPGLVAGDAALGVGTSGTVVRTLGAPVSTGWLASGNPLWVNLWMDDPVDGRFAGSDIRLRFISSGGGSFDVRMEIVMLEGTSPDLDEMDFGYGVVADVTLAATLMPHETGTHMYTATVDPTTPFTTINLYRDGINLAGPKLIRDGWTTFDTTGLEALPNKLSPPAPAAHLVYDELAFGSGLPSDADVAALYAAASTSFAAYTAAQLAFGSTCEGYYHLDEGAAGWHVGVIGMGT